MSRYVPNENAPQVRFVRVRGRIIPIVQGKKKLKAAAILDENLQRMKVDVDVAEAGRRIPLADGTWTGHKSTFPKHFKRAGFKTKHEWLSAYNRQEGPKFERILRIATGDRAFRVATSQMYDNHLTIFRTIDNRVRPIKLKSAEEFEFYNWKEKKR